MSLVEFTVDANTILEGIATIIGDVSRFDDSSRSYATRFIQEAGQARFLVQVVNKHLLANAETGALLRPAVERTCHDLNRSHEKIRGLLLRDGDPELCVAKPATPTNMLTRVAATPTARRLTWAFGRKSSVEKILSEMQRSNDFLRQALQDFQLACAIGQITHVSQPFASPTTFRSSDQSAHSALAIQQRRLDIRGGRVPPNANLLRHASFLDVTNASALEGGSNLSVAMFERSSNVLVERYYIGDLEDPVELRALEQATMLSQPRVTGFNVLPCKGLVYRELGNTYEFILDPGVVLDDLRETGVQLSTTAQLFPSFHSLNYHLQMGEDVRNTTESDARPRVFRYSSLDDESRSHQISLLERLVFARSLALTLDTLHLANWIHGNMTSRNVLFFQDFDRSPTGEQTDDSAVDVTNSTRLGRPYLFGFQFTRLVNDRSNQRVWNKEARRDNVYRHPDRQVHRSRQPAERHSADHDIYSLGVLFLEIGLGRPAQELLDLEKKRRQKAPTGSDAGNSKDVFVELAQRWLPQRTDRVFTQVVTSCLSGNLRALGEEGQSSREHPFRAETLSMAFWRHVIDPLDGMIDGLLKES